jgi:hypothetical protein
MRGVGYLISVVSVILLGLVAWPKPDDPAWHRLVLIAGMTASIVGMLLRWLESRRQRAQLHHVQERTGLR